MGVPGYHKLIDEVPYGSFKLNMIESIKDWKQTHPEEDPIIVVNWTTFFCFVVAGKNLKDAVFGGRYHLYNKKLNRFFNEFSKIGTKFVFFSGKHSAFSVEECCNKHETNYENGIKILDEIDRYKEIKLNERNDVPGSCALLALCIRQISRQYGEFKDISHVAVVHAMKQYASTNKNVVAIFDYNSSFLMYDLGEEVQYWRCDTACLDMNSFETTTYDVNVVRDFLKLTKHQYHMLAALLTTLDNHGVKDMSSAKKKLYYLPQRRIPMMLAFVRTDCSLQYVGTDFRKFAESFFQKKLGHYGRIIQDEYKKLCNVVGDNVINVEEEIWEDVETYLSKRQLHIWKNECFSDSISLIDLREYDKANGKTYSDLLLAMWKKASGILLYAKRDENLPRKLILKRSHYELTKTHLIDRVYPNFVVPDIKDLYSEVNASNDNLLTVKWNIFLWILNLDRCKDLITRYPNVPQHILPTVVTALFLLNEHQITSMEADVIIICENEIIINNELLLENASYPKSVDGRFIRLAHMYLHGREIIDRAFSFSGLKKLRMPLMFDGVLFHELMLQYSEDANSFQIAQNKIKDFCVDAFGL